MINCNKIKADIMSDSFCGCYVWEYNGENCGIDPIGTKEGMTFHIWYGSKPDFVAKNWDEAFNTKYFGGKSLKEILPDIREYGRG